jgi:RluA family pseudouridine synthase
MSATKNAFKSSPRRYHPEGLTILHEDRDILVVDKACGLLTVGTETVQEQTAYFLLTDYVRKGNPKAKSRVFIVHRLDRETSGVLVFAKNEPAKRFLQDEWHKFRKTYFAVVHGMMEPPQGIISSYLAQNRAFKVYSVDNPKAGKLAETAYRVLRTSSKYSLLEIELLTGKKHQIRVQFADQNHPVVGDKRYGRKEAGIKRLALHASTLTLLHPHTKEQLTFNTTTPGYLGSLLGK